MRVPEIDEHRKYLNDADRVSAYARAIEESVRPGDVVVDLGSGTGILGLLACRAGAKRVYSIEQTGMIEVARALCTANGFENRVSFVNEHSRHADLPERADVVVTDQVGYFGFDAGAIELLGDACQRFLKPTGTLVPGRMELCVAPVERPDMAARIAFWNQPSEGGFDLSAARPWAVNAAYLPVFSREQCLADPVAALSIDLFTAVSPILRLDATTIVARAGILHGIGGWCVAQLSPSVRLSNFPGAHYSVDRWNVFFPIDRPIAVAEGDHIRIAMQIHHTEMLVSWTVDVTGDKASATVGVPRNARFAHSMFQGLLVSQEELARTRPDFVPTLTPRGQARLEVLTLCSHRRPMEEIVGEIHGRHPSLFSSVAEAKVFVTQAMSENVR